MLSLPEAEAGMDTIRVASYVAIPLFVVGLIGNGILMRLMIKEEVRQLSSSTFLLGVTITDTIILVYEIMDDIAIHINDYTGYDILFGFNQWRCRFGVFFYQTARTISAWLVVAMVAELCTAASSPLRRKVVYYKNRALYVSMAIVLVAIAAGFPFLVLTQQGNPDEEMPSCSSVYEVFFLVYSEFVLKGATQFAFPVLFIIICNLVSFVALTKQKPQASRFGGVDHFVSQHDVSNRRGTSMKTKVQAANTIYMISLLYLLTVSPATVAELIITVRRFLADFEYTQDWSIAINVTGVIFMANYALKFFCIVLFGKDYRAAIAGKMLIWTDDEPEVSHTNGQVANGVVSNSGYTYGTARNPADIRLDVK